MNVNSRLNVTLFLDDLYIYLPSNMQYCMRTGGLNSLLGIYLD